MTERLKKIIHLLIYQLSKKINIKIEKKFIYMPSYNVNIIQKIKSSHIKSFLPNKYIPNKRLYIWTNDWFKQRLPIKNYNEYNLNYNSVFQIFDRKISYKNSNEYRIKLEQLKKKNVDTRGHKNINELNSYFINLSKIYNDIKLNGYKSQKKLKSKSIYDEIGVFLGPNGEIIKAEDKYKGTHRFAISKILKLKYIYINVRAVDIMFLKNHIFKNITTRDNEKVVFEKIKLYLKKYKIK